MTPRRLAFVDTETTSLGHLARPWEISLITRDAADASLESPDKEWLWHVLYTDETLPPGTTPEALRIGGWLDRGTHSTGPEYRDHVYRDEDVYVGAGGEFAIARAIHGRLEDAVLVGVGVHFDAAVLSAMFRRHGLPEEPWHYAIVDLKAATWGHLGYLARVAMLTEDERAALALPMASEQLSRAVGVEPPAGNERHTALGDARWARRWFDRLQRGDRS